MPITRRNLLKLSSGVALTGTATLSLPALSLTSMSSRATAVPRHDDEAYWAKIASYYDLTTKFTNVENGNWGVMARPVLEAYQEHTRRVNRDNSWFSRREFAAEKHAILEQTAARLDVSMQELAFTRGATEALQNIIGGFNGLSAGDAVMIADLDYGSIQAAMKSIAKRHKCEIVELTIPEPTSYEGIISFYRDAFRQHPNTKFLLLTHVSHRTGLVVPVREISEIARSAGISVVVDAAHSWGQMDFTLPELGADFVGLNLHKWIGAPIGVGAMYIRKDRLGDIDPNISATESEFGSIEGRVHSGTSNFAALLSVPDAFAFHDFVNPQAKEARLRYLQSIWTSRCRDNPAINILTPNDDRLHAGITSFRISGRRTVAENKAIAETLLTEHGIYTVYRDGIAAGACVRVTPSIYNSATDLMAVANAINNVSSQLIPKKKSEV